MSSAWSDRWRRRATCRCARLPATAASVSSCDRPHRYARGARRVPARRDPALCAAAAREGLRDRKGIWLPCCRSHGEGPRRRGGVRHLRHRPGRRFPELEFLNEWLARGYHGEMHYLARNADRRADVRAVLPSATRGDHARHGLQRRPSVLHRHRRPIGRARSRATPGAMTTTPVIEDRMRAPRRGSRGARRPLRAQGLRRHRAGPGARLREVRRARLDRQEHLPDQPRPRLVALPLGDHLRPAARTGRARARSLRPVHAVHRCVSDRRDVDRPVSARRDGGASRISRSRTRARFPESSARRSAHHAYGCDICQDVCPWNRQGRDDGRRRVAAARRARRTAVLELWTRTRRRACGRLLKGSAMKRAGVRRLRRNLAVAIGNSGDPAAADVAGGAGDDTCADPLVREHVAWAVERLRGWRPRGAKKLGPAAPRGSRA